jgi:hypothetical protein
MSAIVGVGIEFGTYGDQNGETADGTVCGDLCVSWASNLGGDVFLRAGERPATAIVCAFIVEKLPCTGAAGTVEAITVGHDGHRGTGRLLRTPTVGVGGHRSRCMGRRRCNRSHHHHPPTRPPATSRARSRLHCTPRRAPPGWRQMNRCAPNLGRFGQRSGPPIFRTVP